MTHPIRRKQINLYQAEFRPVRPVLSTQSLLLGAAAFAAGLAALHAWDRWELHRLRTEADLVVQRAEGLEQKLAQSATPPRQADPAVLAEIASLEARVKALQRAQELVTSGALGSDAGYAARFIALTQAKVPGAWLTRIEVTQGGKVMNLEGRALKGEDAARLIHALGRQPTLSGLAYAKLNVQPAKAEEKAADKTTPAATDKDPGYLEFSLSAEVGEQRPPSTPMARDDSPTKEHP
jgi:hypothetical protein